MDTDYAGHDIWSGSKKNWQECAMKCKEDDNCVVWTYANGYCWNKDAIGKRGDKPDHISSLKNCPGVGMIE